MYILAAICHYSAGYHNCGVTRTACILKIKCMFPLSSYTFKMPQNKLFPKKKRNVPLSFSYVISFFFFQSRHIQNTLLHSVHPFYNVYISAGREHWFENDVSSLSQPATDRQTVRKSKQTSSVLVCWSEAAPVTRMDLLTLFGSARPAEVT